MHKQRLCQAELQVYNGDYVIDFELKGTTEIRAKVLKYMGKPEMMGVTVNYKWKSCVEVK